MAEIWNFDKESFQSLLLSGMRRAFHILQERYAAEHIYYYVLALSSELNTLEPGINTETALARNVARMHRALTTKGKLITPQELDLVLRYDLPELPYRIQPLADPALAEATLALTEFGARYQQAFDEAASSIEYQADCMPETPYDQLHDDLLEIPRQVLRTLDQEGLFEQGTTRERVVLDLCWFEGGMPDALIPILDSQCPPRSPLNSPALQARYEQVLAQGMSIARALFT